LGALASSEAVQKTRKRLENQKQVFHFRTADGGWMFA